ncbi:hypothetical protein TNCV_2474811 [Trichonephila clavipes]|nr:hypothetical protein TNCV_2474811 [Trichonephila clavipes]
MKQFKEKGQMEQDNYWKSIVEDLKSERDIFKNEFQFKENEWKAERDALKSERDTFKAERDIFKAERDIFKAEINVFKTERDNLLLENCGLRRMLINVTQNVFRFIATINMLGNYMVLKGFITIIKKP